MVLCILGGVVLLRVVVLLCARNKFRGPVLADAPVIYLLVFNRGFLCHQFTFFLGVRAFTRKMGAAFLRFFVERSFFKSTCPNLKFDLLRNKRSNKNPHFCPLFLVPCRLF